MARLGPNVVRRGRVFLWLWANVAQKKTPVTGRLVSFGCGSGPGVYLRVQSGFCFQHRLLIGVALVAVCGVTAGHFECPLAATDGKELCLRTVGQLRLRRRSWLNMDCRLVLNSLHPGVEPPDADSHVRWCGGRDQQWPRLPDLAVLSPLVVLFFH